MRQLRIGLWLMAVGVWLLVGVTYVHAEEGDVKGCYITYNGNNGSFLYEPAIKIAHEKTNPSQDGEPEIWIFRPWNLEPPDENGKTNPVNVLESRFIPMGKFKEVQAGTVKRMVKCPEGYF